MNTKLSSVTTDRVTLERLIELHPDLANTPWRLATRSDGFLAIEVEGAHREAMLWRAAIFGRIYPSYIDRHGVRRQLVVGSGVQVQMICSAAAA